MFLSLVDSLRDRQFTEEYEKAKAIFQEALSMQDELVLFQGLKNAIDTLTAERQMTIVFLFDRFEEYIPMLTPEFFANLRVLRNRAKYQFATVFSLNRPLEDSVEPVLLTEYYDFLVGHYVYLPIKDDAGTEFRKNYLETLNDKKLPVKNIRDVIAITGGFTREVKVCLQVLLQNEIDYASEEELTNALLTHKTVQRPLYELWQTLTPSEQDFVMNGNYQESDQDYAYLTAVGLLAEGKLTIPLFDRFLHHTLTTGQTDATKHSPLSYDVEKNEIRKGPIILSDSLTASEFKLLLFLLQHAEQILDRETVIAAVWNTGASTAGVTDQAVDQLIFRVRKKIEEDPNNPQHLQTVKGRGYKFTP
jgi:DNA-binding winged helix-turn-helix (wHTH) protein